MPASWSIYQLVIGVIVFCLCRWLDNGRHKMDRVKEYLSHQYSYPHEHSRHAVLAVFISTLFFVSSDNVHSLIHKFDTNIKWWSIYGLLLGFFYFFSSPFLVRTIQANYSNFNRWYVLWLLIAAVYHLPSFQSMGVDIRMNLSLFLTLFMSSVLILVVFHICFVGLWYLKLAPRLAGNRPEILTILQNCTVLSIACCVFYSHCGNRGPAGKPLGRQTSSSGFFESLTKSTKSTNSNRTKWFRPYTLQEVKDQVCNTWLAPVGGASDYPFFSKWVVYSELMCQDACFGASDVISPVYSLWATFIGLYIANYVVERTTGWALTHPKAQTRRIVTAPEFLDMVPWYSGTSADLFKTAFDLIISVTLFLGRFDLRTMQAAVNTSSELERDGFLYSHFSQREEMWFDFMADTGDGGNSTYTVARLLAQPTLKIEDEEASVELPRSSLLIVGGDLAYPNPSRTSYEERLFRPFEYAMQPPSFYKTQHIAAKKPELPAGVESLQAYDGPQCFAIPGNHDWFDGLDTFMRHICHKSWLGGWLLPQVKSYFALKLPHGWWIFCLDQALHEDIDLLQFKYFSELAKEQVLQDDNVVVITHEPNWLLDWYWDGSTGKNVSHLINDHLKGRCRVRMAGDLHFYMRHTATPFREDAAAGNRSVHASPVEHLVVNGCGGAFLHPTHAFTNFSEFDGSQYQRTAVYPLPDDSRRIALGNILKFRKKNWRFDVIGGILYFVLVFSMFPQCDLDHVLQKDSFFGHLQQVCYAIGRAVAYLLEDSYVSLAGLFAAFIFAVLFVPGKVSRRKRFIIGFLHCCSHLIASILLMLLLELGIETCVRHGLLGTAGYHTLYEWYRTVENDHFPDPTGLRARMEAWTRGFYPACLKYLMSAFDVPEVIAVTRSNICKTGLDSVSRGYKLIYYSSVFLYYWVFSTPVVSFVFGSYLYTCINWLNLHFDEAFSSLRVANYKSFLRCHITTSGDLEVYTLAVDKVPKEWMLDPCWDDEKVNPSYRRQYPSQWRPLPPHRDSNCNVRIVDHFVAHRSRPAGTT